MYVSIYKYMYIYHLAWTYIHLSEGILVFVVTLYPCSQSYFLFMSYISFTQSIHSFLFFNSIPSCTHILPYLTLSYLIFFYFTLPSLFFSFYYSLLSHLSFLLPILPIFDAAYYRSREEWNVLIEGCGFKRGTYGITEWGDRRLLTTPLLSTPTFPLGFCFHCLFFTLSAFPLLLNRIMFFFLHLFILFYLFFTRFIPLSSPIFPSSQLFGTSLVVRLISFNKYIS